MSLLDDVSIVVTPNGYKAGELYAIVPVPTEGAEEIDDGSFANDLDDWSKYGVTSATDGIATIGASANSGIYQTILTEGVRYTVTFNVTSYDGVGTAQFTNGNGNNLYTITETGIQTFTFISAISSGQIILRGMSNALFSVSSVSVKEYTAADMDVTRATAATRVDEDGLVNYAEIIGDEELDNGDFSGGSTGWILSGAWILGTNKVIFSDTTNGDIRTSSVIFTATKTYQIKLTVADLTGSNTAFFGIGDGSASNLVGYDNYANGDYTFTVTAPNGSGFRIYSTTSSGSSYSITNISVKEVTRDNVPRIDYTKGGCPHILAEPMRTNLIPYSEDFSNAAWSKSGSVTIESNSVTSPSGILDGSKLVSNNATSNQLIKESFGVNNGNDYTLSCFVKKQGFDYIHLRFEGGGGSFPTKSAFFNINNGTLGTIDSGITATIEDYNNGWYRVTATNTATATATATIRIQLASSDNTDNVVGNGTSGTYIWGAQVEEGSYATSYIPNFGTAAGVTRNQDIFTRDGIGSLINSEEGVLFAEIASLSESGNYRELGLSDGTTSNRVLISYKSTDNVIRGSFQGSGGANLEYTVTSSKDFHKIAVKWRENDFALWVDGVERATDTSGSSFPADTLNSLALDDGGGASKFFGKVKQLQVYTKALTDTQLAALTS